MKYYPLFRKENTIAYLTIMIVWAIISIVCSYFINRIFLLPFFNVLIWSAVMVLLGMNIMFIASLINLIKLRKGFKRLEQGYDDPDIPPVWCPVLTAATNAAFELTNNLKKRNGK